MAIKSQGSTSNVKLQIFGENQIVHLMIIDRSQVVRVTKYQQDLYRFVRKVRKLQQIGMAAKLFQSKGY